MVKTKVCSVQLLNKSYEIKCPELEQERLLLASKKLNEIFFKTQHESNQLDDFQILLITALQMAHELMICQHQKVEQEQQLAQYIGSLEHKINQVTRGACETSTMQKKETDALVV